MSLLERLEAAYLDHKNFEDRNFIPFEVAQQIVTSDEIDVWSQSHPLCLEHGSDCSERIDLVRKIPEKNLYVFVVLAFAGLECLTKRLLSSGSHDALLFDNGIFERCCKSAELSAEQKQSLVKCRSYVAVIFSNDSTQDIPQDAILPFLKREGLPEYGSFGVIYRVTIPAYHLQGFSHETTVAEKRIRPTTNLSQGDWQNMLREVETLRSRKNHHSIISLLASYTAKTDESGHYKEMLHLLFPLADMNLDRWMNKDRVPSHVAEFSWPERQQYLYRSMLALASGVSYLHREIDGMVTAHHDLKPRNILMVRGQLKIADLGHSHLRPLSQGSATERASGLGTYDYQPPEYWNEDGSRADVLHGRQFDVWALGCIILEMATLVVHDWQPQKIAEFRSQRLKNPRKDRQVPGSIPAASDDSFHNNMSVVRGWIERLKAYDDSQQLNDVLNIVVGTLAPDPRNRLHAWEVELDLYDTLKSFDRDLPDLREDPCVPPRPGEIDDMETLLPDKYRLYHTETPLHRAAKKNNRKRIIRLWELGWPVWFPDQTSGQKRTPWDIMEASANVEIRDLARDSTQLINAANTNNIGLLKELFSKGLSPLMADAHGTSALHQAIKSNKIDVVTFLLQSKAEEQLMLRERFGRYTHHLPLHIAASVGFVAALEWMLRYHPDINALNNYGHTALYLATLEGHHDAVRFLLEKKAQLLPSDHRGIIKDTPLHAAVDDPDCTINRYSAKGQPELHTGKVRVGILNLLLGADGALECLEGFDSKVPTPLYLALQNGYVDLFETLLRHGASVHTVGSYGNVLHTIAIYNRPETLKKCIDRFSLEDFAVESQSSTPLKMAEQQGHKEVARLMKSRIKELRRSAGDDSRPWRKFAVFEWLKRP